MSKYDLKNILKIVSQFKGTKTLVIGDIIVDHFVWGKVSRLSPEAPVPVVEVSKESFVPGGSGNVAHNIAALKGQVFLCGVTGHDLVGSQIVELISDLGVDTSGVFTDAGIPTIQKTRIIANIQQVVRIDREDRESKDKRIITQILQYLKETIPQVDAIIISDYGKGMISVPLLKEAIKLAHRYGKVITVDPKVEHFLKYRGVTCITPNHLEAAQGIHYPVPRDQAETEILGEKIIRKLHCQSLLITQGEKGMTLFEQGKRSLHIPTMAREVFDVTGAGDTVISTLTLALAAGADLKQAAYIANHAAGIVVAKVGTATCSPEELMENLSQDKAGLKL
ncbi:MAG: D-glycero-beta-D-manno-heptose-7-phosphate kinase [bacterium]|nr:D-glycero-beta-D-manno-heptose-7-phosphate kinase [bacterium]MDD5354284.1 D-glycero-beta-D-manno-heptose-7-phosphate kinase [bacterium]MDD5755728.1 D-glycero-beta-D-manno-heptose-7-phosphate kinase [bacterium]